MNILTELFCQVDDFCIEFNQQIEQYLLEHELTRIRQTKISISEIITLLIYFHQIRYWHFKAFYTFYAQGCLSREFPNLPSYHRFIELVPRAIYPMMIFLNQLLGKCHGVSIIDSTKLSVCHNKRISQHKVFKHLAKRGKSSTGWFFGFKLHIVINQLGEITAFKVTTGDVHDTKVVEELLSNKHHGIVIGDKGYLSQKLSETLADKGIKLITKVRKNMKQPNHSSYEKNLLKQRSLIETVFDQLKNLFQIEHSRHRSLSGFVSNLISGLIAYCLTPNKPKMTKSLCGGLMIC